jgi:hypothetical protein
MLASVQFLFCLTPHTGSRVRVLTQLRLFQNTNRVCERSSG